MARGTVDNRLDALHIGLPGTVGASVGVGNLNAEGNALTTKITLSHSLHLLSSMVITNYCLLQALRYDTRVRRKMQVFFLVFFTFFKIVLIFSVVTGIMTVKTGGSDGYE